MENFEIIPKISKRFRFQKFWNNFETFWKISLPKFSKILRFLKFWNQNRKNKFRNFRIKNFFGVPKILEFFSDPKGWFLIHSDWNTPLSLPRVDYTHICIYFLLCTELLGAHSTILYYLSNNSLFFSSSFVFLMLFVLSIWSRGSCGY